VHCPFAGYPVEQIRWEKAHQELTTSKTNCWGELNPESLGSDTLLFNRTTRQPLRTGLGGRRRAAGHQECGAGSGSRDIHVHREESGWRGGSPGHAAECEQ